MKIYCRVKVSFTKNCIASVSSSLLSTLFPTNSSAIIVVKVTFDAGSCYLSLLPIALNDNAELRLNSLYANKLGLDDGSDVLVEPVHNVQACVSAWLEPLTVDDWEILELHSNQVETQLLDQLRVVWPGQVFPLWVDQNVCIYMRTVKTEPNSSCSCLIHLSQLIVEPKIHGVLPTPRIQSNPQQKNEVGAMTPNSIVNDNEKEIASTKWMFFRRLYRVAKFIVLYIWKQFLPGLYAQLKNVFFPFGSSDPTLEYSRAKINIETVKQAINLVPDSFDVNLRVEAAEENYLSPHHTCAFEQPNTVFLQMPGALPDDNSVLYLVLFTRIPSPLEKNKSQQRSKANTTSNESASHTGQIDSCVVRMFVHPRSPFAMICDTSTLDMHHLKVPLCLRRQLQIGCTSRARIQKLNDFPLLCDNISSITFNVHSSPRQLKPEDFNDVLSAFKSWLSTVCDVTNPLPFMVGTLLSFPISDDSEIGEDNLELVITDIKHKVEDKKSKKEVTYLLCPEDLHHISIDIKLAKLYDIPLKVDPEIPSESVHLYCSGFEDKVQHLSRYLEMALKARPIATKLSCVGMNPGVLLLSGLAGSGKTTLCRALMKKFATDSTVFAYCHSLSCSQLYGKKPENIKKKLDAAVAEVLWRQPSILLLDGMDHLVASVADEDRSVDAAYLTQVAYYVKSVLKSLLMSDQQSNRVAVIVTAKTKNSIHSTLTCVTDHLFTDQVHLSLPNSEERKKIFTSVIENLTAFESPNDLDKVVSKTEGYVVSDIVKIVQRSCHMLKLQPPKEGSYSNVLPVGTLLESLDNFTPASLQNARLHKPTPLTWKHVGGLKDIKQKLLEQLVWPLKYSHVFDECGFDAQSGILLFGPPGCGKTLIASVVANECGLNFISVKGPELLSKYIGASEAGVRDLFSRAKAASPCVLFFDEFDSLAPPRGHDSTGVTDRVVNQLLTHLDGVEPLVGVTVMAASSRPDLIDPALLRPGRLDNLLYCPMPDSKERLDILFSLSQGLPVREDIDLVQLADQCSDFSGADLKALLYNAQLEAVHDLCKVNLSVDSHLQESTKAEFQLYSSGNSESSTISTASFSGLESDDMQQYTSLVTLVKPDLDLSQPLSSDSVDNLKQTAAKLIESLHEVNTNPSHSQLQYDPSDQLIQKVLAKDSSSSNISEESPAEKLGDITHFASIHRGKARSVPAEVEQTVRSIIKQLSCHDSQLKVENRASEPGLVITPQHIQTALASTRPSLTANDLVRFESLYSNFVRSRDKTAFSKPDYYEGKQRATLS